MKPQGPALMGSLFGSALAALLGAAASAPVAAQTTQPVLYRFFGPSGQPPVGDFGRCSSHHSASSYTAVFELRRLPAGDYGCAWTTESGLALAGPAARCSQTYRGGMEVADIVDVTCTNRASGESKTPNRPLPIPAPF